MFLTKKFAIAALMAIALNQPLVRPASSAPAHSDLQAEDAAAPQLHEGDRVRLRSGGPLMTVETVKGSAVDCIWTDPNGQTDEATFPVKVLQKI